MNQTKEFANELIENLVLLERAEYDERDEAYNVAMEHAIDEVKELAKKYNIVLNEE